MEEPPNDAAGSTILEALAADLRRQGQSPELLLSLAKELLTGCKCHPGRWGESPIRVLLDVHIAEIKAHALYEGIDPSLSPEEQLRKKESALTLNDLALPSVRDRINIHRARALSPRPKHAWESESAYKQRVAAERESYATFRDTLFPNPPRGRPPKRIPQEVVVKRLFRDLATALRAGASTTPTDYLFLRTRRPGEPLDLRSGREQEAACAAADREFAQRLERERVELAETPGPSLRARAAAWTLEQADRVGFEMGLTGDRLRDIVIADEDRRRRAEQRAGQIWLTDADKSQDPSDRKKRRSQQKTRSRAAAARRERNSSAVRPERKRKK
jgi:hypothetical protein